MSISKISFSPAAKKYVKEQIPVISKKEAETRENLMFLGGLAIGIAAGVVIGAGITALTTPKSGVETRQDIRDKKDLAVNGVKETSSKVADKVKSTADGVVDKIKDKFAAADEDEVVVEYTIRYDDEDEATVETCGCGCGCEEAPTEEEPAEEAPAEEGAEPAEEKTEESESLKRIRRTENVRRNFFIR